MLLLFFSLAVLLLGSFTTSAKAGTVGKRHVAAPAAPEPVGGYMQARRADIVKRAEMRSRYGFNRRAPMSSATPITCGSGTFYLQYVDTLNALDGAYAFVDYSNGEGFQSSVGGTRSLSSATVFTLSPECYLVQLSNGYESAISFSRNPSPFRFFSPEFIANRELTSGDVNRNRCSIQGDRLSCTNVNIASLFQLCGGELNLAKNGSPPDDPNQVCDPVGLRIIQG